MRELKQLGRMYEASIQSRTPHGVRELKLLSGKFPKPPSGRTPHGVRELKRGHCEAIRKDSQVAPLTGCVN